MYNLLPVTDIVAMPSTGQVYFFAVVCTVLARLRAGRREQAIVTEADFAVVAVVFKTQCAGVPCVWLGDFLLGLVTNPAAITEPGVADFVANPVANPAAITEPGVADFVATAQAIASQS